MIQNVIWHICTWLMPVIHYFWLHLSTIRKSMMPLIGHAHSLKTHPLDHLIFHMGYALYGHLVYSQHPEVWNGTCLPWECWREKAGGADLIALAKSGLFFLFVFFLRGYRLCQLGEQSLMRADSTVGGTWFTCGMHPDSARMLIRMVLSKPKPTWSSRWA